jgi:galactokinase
MDLDRGPKPEARSPKPEAPGSLKPEALSPKPSSIAKIGYNFPVPLSPLVDAALVSRVHSAFTARFGHGGNVRVAVAPGRVNLIGDHTDYNGGYVLPMAIDRHTAVAFRARDDGRLRAHAEAYDETRLVPMSDLDSGRRASWFAYVAGVAWAMREAGHVLRGADMVIDSTVPVGAGLSSSAALEMSVLRALVEVEDVAWDAREMARLGQRAEHEFAGVPCGIMDQFASACAREGTALLLDCRTLEAKACAIPDHLAILIADSGVEHALVAGAYAERRASCELAVARLRAAYPDVRALRDVTLEMLKAERGALDPTTWRRARHVVEECRRPVDWAEAIERADAGAAGALMDASHASLRDLYEVSCPEVEQLRDIVRRQPGCHGARMNGAGFGGSVVALVDAGAARQIVGAAKREYRTPRSVAPLAFIARPAGGAHVVDRRAGRPSI